MLVCSEVAREEIVVATKVGNVLGQQIAYADGVANMAKINDSRWTRLRVGTVEDLNGFGVGLDIVHRL